MRLAVVRMPDLPASGIDWRLDHPAPLRARQLLGQNGVSYGELGNG